jgi:uncharacterized membrane protein YphA (DoxX/SURF4 family)
MERVELVNVALWVVQILLAAVFLVSGVLKSAWPKDRLIASGQTGVAPFPVPVIRLTAASELVAVVGLIAPRWSGISPVLTPLAALGLCVVMLGALLSHGRLLRADHRAGRGHKEARNVAANTLILLLCLWVAVGRV